LQVSVIDTATNTVVATVAVGTNPIGVAITPNGSFAYVANETDNSVSVINTATNAVVTTVSVGSSPHGIAITPDGASAYVANQISNNVSVISTANNTVVATVNVSAGPIGVASGPAALAKLNNFTALVGVSKELHATAVAGQFHPSNTVDPLTQSVTLSVAGSNSASVTFASFKKVGSVYSTGGKTV